MKRSMCKEEPVLWLLLVLGALALIITGGASLYEQITGHNIIGPAPREEGA